MDWLNNLDQVVDRFIPDADNADNAENADSADSANDCNLDSSSHLSANERDMMIMIDPMLPDMPFTSSSTSPSENSAAAAPHDQFCGGFSRIAETISNHMPQLPSSRPQRLVLYNKSPQKTNSGEFDDFLSAQRIPPSAAVIEPDLGYLSDVPKESDQRLEDSTSKCINMVHVGSPKDESSNDQSVPLSSEQSTGDVTTERPNADVEQLPTSLLHATDFVSHQSNDEDVVHLSPSILDRDSDSQQKLAVESIIQPKPEYPPENDPLIDLPMMPLHIWETTQDIEDSSDLNVSFPLEEWNPIMSQPFDTSLNQLGVVHVRILAAQRLPCPVGSTVQAIVALPPWKGRVRSERVTTVGGPLEFGVVARWDQLNEGSGCSMVHAWNSSETPIPSIKLELMYNPIKLLEFAMSSLTLSCEPLMREPRQWKRQWCKAETDSTLASSDRLLDGHTPLILLEAAFFPAEDENKSNEDDIEKSTDGKIPGVSNHEFVKFERRESNEESLDGSRHSRRSRGTTSSLSYMLTSKTKPHLLRVHSFWVPANCSVCAKSIIGWKRGYRCEVCVIDCCIDCQLQIDLQIPCGSGQAKMAVEKSIQNKMTIGNVLSTIAPVDDAYIKKEAWKQSHHTSRNSTKLVTGYPYQDDSNDASPIQGIGVVKINVRHAKLFAQSLPPDSDPTDIFDASRELRPTDLYVRITPRGRHEKSARTTLVQNSGAPVFDSDEFILSAPDYAMEYRIELVDASSDKPVGSTLLTAQSLLQLQRDEMIAEKGISAFVRGLQDPARYMKHKHLALELRTGLKTGFGSDFYVKTKSKNDDSRAGEITGWLSIDVCFEENTDALFGPSPIECPPRPPDDLNTDLFQVHIGRITNILRDVKKGINGYIHVVSWKNPALTAFSFLVFVTVTLRFNTEYIGTLPVFSLICYMLYLAYIRTSGHLKDRFIDREKESRTQGEKEATVKYSLHRPLGRIEVSVRRGKNLRSRDIGLPGSVGCHVIWDPTRYTKSEKERINLCSVDKALKTSHPIGSSNYSFTTNPVWTQMIPSDETKRVHQLLPKEGSFFTLQPPDIRHGDNVKGDQLMWIEFPIPQPMKASDVRENLLSEDGNPRVKYELEPWSTSPGAIIVQVRMSDVINKLRLDDVLGEIAIPISKIAGRGEIKGWFQVLEPGANHVIPVGGEEDGEVESNDAPLVYLHFRWNCPDSFSNFTDMNREASIVVTEELIRSAVKAASSKINLVGSSIGAFNTVRGVTGNIAAIQNTLGSILDVVEALRNAFNFTDPYKSSIVLFLLSVLWLFLASVPTRALILVAGIGQYTATFFAAFLPKRSSKKNNTKAEPAKSANLGSILMIWIVNALRGLPTDEDLRKAYFWESRRIGEMESSKIAHQRRLARLQRLWKAQWYSLVGMKAPLKRKGSTNDKSWQWESVFAVVHGRRMLWWSSTNDFDEGDAPAGYIFLAGHAGLAGLSPLDLRELEKAELPRVVNIFGRGNDGQQKLMLLLPTEASKEELESAVLSVSVKGD